MKHRHNALIVLVIILSLLDVCLALTNYSSNPPIGTVSNIKVNFPDEQRWIEVLEGGSGGGNAEGFVIIHLEDKGYNDSPHVTLSDEHGTIKNFSMVTDEVAKIYIMDKQNGSILRTIILKDPQDSISYEILQIFNNIWAELSHLVCLLGITSSC